MHDKHVTDGNKVLEFSEEAPHLELNQDGTTIDLANWSQPANRNWSYRHSVEFFPYTKKISRASSTQGNAHILQEKPVDLSSVTIPFRGKDMHLDEYIKESHCNGLMVLKGNDIIYENQCRMSADERHLSQSISKTTACAVVGILVEQGLIDLQQSVDHYIPGIGNGFKGVKLQDLLDMNVGLKFNEDFTDANAEIHEYEMVTGWRPEAGGQAEGALAYIKGIEHDPDLTLNAHTNYMDPNTEVLGFIAEKVTGKRFTQLFEELIYEHIDAQADAYFCVDALGAAICSGGLIIGLRDLARYAQLFANKGVANDGTQVIPKSWIEDCLDTTKGTDYYIGENFKYHNHMTSNGSVLCHLGLGAQLLYANTETKVVVVQFSTYTSAASGDLDIANALYDLGKAMNNFLSK